MSLSIHLYIPRNLPNIPEECTAVVEPVVYFREDGERKSLSIQEYAAKFPNRNFVASFPDTGTAEEESVFERNITHNLGMMANEAGLYEAMWNPAEIHAMYAKDVIEPLETGIKRLESDPDYYMQWNPKNGWGNYDGLLSFAKSYLKACKEYPEATIWISK